MIPYNTLSIFYVCFLGFKCYSSVCSFEPRPSENDLLDHMDLISEVVKHDDILAKSKVCDAHYDYFILFFLLKYSLELKHSYLCLFAECAKYLFIDLEAFYHNIIRMLFVYSYNP